MLAWPAITSLLLVCTVPLTASLCPKHLIQCSCSGENVRCYGLQLTSVPRVPPNTRLLDLRYNNITELAADDFSGLASLRTLLLQSNHIAQIDSRAFQPLANLEAIYLSYNFITTLSSNLFQFLRNVRIIYLDVNQLSSIDEDAFNGLTSLKNLYLHSNALSRISGATFSSLNKLELLRLDGNPLLCDCQLGWATNYTALRRLSSLVCVQPGDLSGQLLADMQPAQLGCKAPQVNVTLDHLIIRAEQTVMLDCKVTGEPKPVVSWSHDDVDIFNNSRVQVLTDGTLVIKGVMPADKGEYKCHAVNLMGTSVSISVLVSYRGDPVPPQVISHSSADTKVRRGSTTVLRCVARGHPVPIVTWLKDNKILNTSDSRISQPTHYTLQISNVRFSDDGLYICQASNSEGVDQETIKLTVLSPPLIEQTSSLDTIADVGDSVILVCRVTGQPTPSLIWRHNDVVISVNSRHVISGDQLEIKQFRNTDQGLYSCDAINNLGFDRRTFTVFMRRLQLPVFTTTPQSQYISVGHDLILTCSVVGSTSPNQWIHNGTTLTSGGRASITMSGEKLTVRNITTMDSGDYRCLATGIDGRVFSSPADVMVTGEVISCDDISSKVGVQQITREVDNAIKNTTDKMVAKRNRSPSELLSLLKFPSSGTVDLARATEIFDEAVQRYENNFTDTAVTGIPLHLTDCELTVLAKLSGCVSHRQTPNCSDICYHRRYRTADGTCNNLRHPLRGASITPFGRLLASDYDNDLSLPRGWIRPLPSPRRLTHDLLSARASELREDFNYTLMLMQIGQFLDHDLDIAPITPSRDSFENGVSCDETCENTSPCFPIPVPVNDSRIRNRKCLSFTRSSAVCGTGTSSLLVGRAAYRREQINQITSYVDASNIYGSSQDKADLLRDKTIGKGMLLRGQQSSPGHYYLPFDNTSSVDCDQGSNAGRSPCFLAGDVRVNEQVGLTTMHVVWFREHNRVANLLSELNQHWDDETVYQETKLIVSAEWQHVVFTEYVPKILGFEVWNSVDNSYKGYDDSVDSSIVNSFATAAYRFGHSQIMPMLLRLNETWQPTEYGPLPLRNAFFAPHRVIQEGGIDPLLRGLVVEQSKERASDQVLAAEITEHLFEQANSIALDLGALNIQRGRDHGLPSYNRWREYCGLTVATSFDDLAGDISSNETRQKLEQLYGDVNDVDLFVGGILEDLLPKSRLGPTFACIIKVQFQRLRDGDRFYYEKPGLFTMDQLREIKKASLAKLVCSNADNITTIPRDIFVHQPIDQFVPCDQLDTPNLFYWKECKDCDKYVQRRSSPTVFDVGTNFAYEQLQGTVQLLSDKVASLERKCQFNGVSYVSGEYWKLDNCHNCSCQDGEMRCEHINCDCTTSPSHECCPACVTNRPDQL